MYICTYICTYINIFVYIYYIYVKYRYVITKTMCPPGCHHNGFSETHALGRIMLSPTFLMRKVTETYQYAPPKLQKSITLEAKHIATKIILSEHIEKDRVDA